MKKLILILFILSSASLRSQQMFNIGDTWILDFYVYAENINPNKTVISTSSISVLKDTFINNNTYAYVVADAPHECGIFGGENFLRDDGGKIYRYYPSNNKELLVYDYSLTTLNYDVEYTNFSNSTTNFATVTFDSSGIFKAYDGTEINAQYSKFVNNFSYDDDHQYMFLEGIGFKQFLPNLGTGLCDIFNDDNYGALRCFVNEGDTIHFTQYDCNEKVVEILDSASDLDLQIQYKVYPNPTSDVIHVEGEFDSAIVYTLNGQKINSNVRGNKIFLNQPITGIHILMITHKGQEFYKKVVIE